MSTLSAKFQGIAAHNSVFEQAVRQLPLPVCQVFGSATAPTAIQFKDSAQTLGTKDSAKVAESFPNTVKASGNKVLEGAGANPKVAQGKRVAVLATVETTLEPTLEFIERKAREAAEAAAKGTPVAKPAAKAAAKPAVKKAASAKKPAAKKAPAKKK